MINVRLLQIKFWVVLALHRSKNRFNPDESRDYLRVLKNSQSD